MIDVELKQRIEAFVAERRARAGNAKLSLIEKAEEEKMDTAE
jgi:hypothetical protein